MSDGKIEIGVEIDSSGLKGKVESAAKEAGDSAGSALESGLKSGAKNAADFAGSTIESGVESGAKGAADSAGNAIESGIKSGAKEGSEGADFSGIVSAAKEAASGVATALGAVAVVGGIGDLFGSAIDAAQEFSGGMGKLGTTAQALGVDFDLANATFQQFAGITGDTDVSIEAMGTTMQLVGNDAQGMSDWVDIASGVYAEFGDGLPIEGLTEAANETAKCATVTGPFADALNWTSQSLIQQGVALSGNQAATDAFNSAIAQGMTSEDAFNEALAACSDEGERAALITSTMKGAYQEVGQQYQQNNSDLLEYNQAQMEQQEQLANLGAVLMPVKTLAMELGNSFLDLLTRCLQPLGDTISSIIDNGFTPLMEAMDPLYPLAESVGSTILDVFTQVGSFLASTLVPVVTAFFSTVSPMIQQVADYVSGTLWPALQSMFTALQPAIQTLADVLISTVFPAVMSAFQTIAPAAEQLMSVLLPILTQLFSWLGSILPPVIQACAVVFNNIMVVVSTVFATILSIVSGVVSGLVTFFTVTVPGAISSMVSFFSSIPGNIAGFLGNALSSAASFASSFASTAISAASSFVSNIVSGLSGIAGRVASVGSNIVHGIWNGISGAAGWLYNQVAGFASGIISNIKGALGIHSPSKVAEKQVGRYIAEGVGVGYEKYDPSTSIADSLKAGLSKAQSVAMSFSAQPGQSAQAVDQTINFNVPTASPDVVARQMRDYATYGLAGDY